MTTNQTIDGVLAPRELLRRIAGLVPDYTCAQLDADEAELRALLDAQEEPVEVVKADNAEQALTLLDFALSFSLCNMDHGGTRRDVKKAQAHLEAYRKFKAEQPQGEPVAWRYRDDAGLSSWFDGAPGKISLEFVEHRSGIIERAYAEQPAPVAVVLPMRALDQEDGAFFDKGWNACLDQLKRLNPSL